MAFTILSMTSMCRKDGKYDNRLTRVYVRRLFVPQIQVNLENWSVFHLFQLSQPLTKNKLLDFLFLGRRV